MPQHPQRMRRRLAEVQGGVDENPLGRHTGSDCPLRAGPQGRDDIGDHVELARPVGDVDGVGAWG